MFSIDGLVSGLDTASIIDGLVSLQNAQVERLNERKSEILAKQTAFQGIEARLLSLRSVMSRLNRVSNSVFDQRTASSTDESIVTATASNDAIEGSFSLRVTSLAKAHQIGSQGFSDSSDLITTGTISFQVGSRPATTINLDSTNNTVEGLVNAINSQSEDLTATIVHDQATDTDRILLSSRHTGASNQITVTNNLGPTGGGATQPDFSGPAIQDAANATVQLGSGAGAISAEYESNTVDQLIEGVTLNLLAVDANKDVTVSITRDQESTKEAIQDFVDEYNKVIEFIEDQTRFNSETNEASPLLGNRNVSNLRAQLAAFVTETVPGLDNSLSRLSQLGIDIGATGRLSLNSGRLNDVLNGDVEGVNPGDVKRLFGLTATSSSSGIEFLLGSSRTKASTTPYQVDIVQAAEQATIRGGTLKSAVTIDATNNQFQLTLDGKNSEVLTLASGTYTPQELASQVESLINNSAELGTAKVSVTIDGNGALEITSQRYGSSSKIENLSGTALGDLGFTGTETATGKDVAGRFLVDGVVETATGTGRLLMGDADNENTADIQLLVTLTPSQVTTGVEGELSISRGVAAQMDQYLADFFDPVDGSLATINEDFDLRIESLDQSIERVKSITESKREFLVAQFAALERVLSDLQTTSGFLESQLSSLPSFGNQR